MKEVVGNLRDHRKMSERLDDRFFSEMDTSNPSMLKRAIGRERDENEPGIYPTFEGRAGGKPKQPKVY